MNDGANEYGFRKSEQNSCLIALFVPKSGINTSKYSGFYQDVNLNFHKKVEELFI